MNFDVPVFLGEREKRPWIFERRLTSSADVLQSTSSTRSMIERTGLRTAVLLLLMVWACMRPYDPTTVAVAFVRPLQQHLPTQPPLRHRRLHPQHISPVHRHCERFQTKRSLSMSSTGDERKTTNGPRHITVVGGGLAGLSVVYHLLCPSAFAGGSKRQQQSLLISVQDIQDGPGKGGASAVAGGLLHPLSPRGKLVYQGLEGLAMTQRMLKVASTYNTNAKLRSELFRLAADAKSAAQLQQLAAVTIDDSSSTLFGAEWLSREQLIERKIVDGVSSPDSIAGPAPMCFGGLRLYKGCCVIHVPSYLHGLWQACLDMAQRNNHSLEWQTIEQGSSSLNKKAGDDSTVVWCAGSGLWSKSLPFPTDLPVQLVRGQSIELSSASSNATTASPQHALLCGKYSSPLLHPDRVLLGATHEFMEGDPIDDADDDTSWWSAAKVYEELYQRGATVWPQRNTTVHRITRGTRVQTARGNFGRLPMIGRLSTTSLSRQSRHWIFTGLSSRGLLYHGLYGERLARAILVDDERLLSDAHDLWWKQAWKRKQQKDGPLKAEPRQG